VRDRVASLLEEAGHGPVTAVTPAECEAALEPAPSAAVLLALPRDTARPLAHLPELVALSRRVDPGLPIVVVGDGLSAADTAAAYRAGAVDVLFPDKDDEELGRLGGLVERRAARAAGSLLPDRPGVPRILGAHPGMQELARLVERVAPAEATVLVLGESGTGKELVARALHVLSPRRKAPFVAINCAAIPDTLLENELFGHEKGAYTGASATAMGKVEAAEKGTLFLDEIGEMPLPLQSKILRLLQEKTYDRIGGTRTRKADIRIVAATNRDLKEQVAAKDFREDLYYRLSVVPLTLPALRDRPSDIPLLAQRVLERIAGQLGRPGLHFSADAMERMVSYRWPGNVRELENEIERAAVLAHGDEIGPRDLELRSRVADPDRAALARLAPLEGPLEASVERAAAVAARIRIAAALEESGGDRARAAENLGISLDELNERA
jgi:DNA-binding NtrC family response regulator